MEGGGLINCTAASHQGHLDVLGGHLGKTLKRKVTTGRGSVWTLGCPPPITHHEGNLQQRRQLVLVLYGRLWVDEASLVAEGAVGANEDLLRHHLTEDLHLQSVCQDLLRLLQTGGGGTG